MEDNKKLQSDAQDLAELILKAMKLEKYKEDNKKLESEIQDLAEKFENLKHQKKELVDETNMMNEISSLKDEIERLKKQNKETIRKNNELKSQCFDRERRVHAEALEREKTILINNDHLNGRVKDLSTLEDNYNGEIKRITEKLKAVEIENVNLSKKLNEQTVETKNELQSNDVSCQTEFPETANTSEALERSSGTQIEDPNNRISHEERLSMIQSQCSHHSEKSKE